MNNFTEPLSSFLLPWQSAALVGLAKLTRVASAAANR